MSSDCCCSEGSGCATASQRLWLALAGLVALVNAKSTSVCVSYPGDSPQGLCPVFKEAFRSKKEEERKKKGGKSSWYRVWTAFQVLLAANYEKHTHNDQQSNWEFSIYRTQLFLHLHLDNKKRQNSNNHTHTHTQKTHRGNGIYTMEY